MVCGSSGVWRVPPRRLGSGVATRFRSPLLPSSCDQLSTVDCYSGGGDVYLQTHERKFYPIVAAHPNSPINSHETNGRPSPALSRRRRKLDATAVEQLVGRTPRRRSEATAETFTDHHPPTAGETKRAITISKYLAAALRRVKTSRRAPSKPPCSTPATHHVEMPPERSVEHGVQLLRARVHSRGRAGNLERASRAIGDDADALVRLLS